MRNIRNIFFIILLFVTQHSVWSSTIGFIGNKPDNNQLTNEEKAAYNWLTENYKTVYIPIDSLGSLEAIDVLWWHYDFAEQLPEKALEESTINFIKDFISQGGGLFLSGFAPQYVVNLGLETTIPQEIHRGLTTSGNWGFYQRDQKHSIFSGLTNPFAVLSAGLQTWNSICWWNVPSSFHGKWLADVEWNSNILVAAGEYNLGKGKVIFVGAGAYDWYLDNGINTQRNNLEKFTKNIIDYLTPPDLVRLGLIGNSNTLDSLSSEEKEAYTWALANFNASYFSFEEINNSNTLLDSIDVLWWHYDEDTTLSALALTEDIKIKIRNFLNEKKGLLLSGFAAKYVFYLGFENDKPDIISSAPGTSIASGFYKKKSTHPIFDGFVNPYLTLSAGLPVENVSCLWSVPSKFDGEILADKEFTKNVVVCGEYNNENGKTIVVGSPAFDWYVEGGNNLYKNNLEKFTYQIIKYLENSSTEFKDNLFGYLKLDEGNGSAAKEEINNFSFSIQNNFNKPEWVNGVSGKALRLDGYSTWVNVDFGNIIESYNEFSFEAWIALEAYPVSDGAIVNQRDNLTGYFLGLDKLGRWYFTLSLNNQWYTCQANTPLPKNKWNHVAVTFNRASGIKLYLDGFLVSTKQIPDVEFIPNLNAQTFIGRSNVTDYVSNVYPLGAINGIIDEIKFYNKELSNEEILSEYNLVKNLPNPDFSVPSSRFANDMHRPEYHPMPSANWTNEPHGLIYFNNKYHLFFQKNPNGPYWEQIHWGHLSSDDLLHWKEEQIALAPQPGIDSRGVWSGCSIIDNDSLKVIYTAVDGIQARMALAIGDSDLVSWQKFSGNPIINSPPTEYDHLDFRDPFVWKDNNKWYMIIGSGIHDVGGTVFLYRSDDLINWDYLHPLKTGDKNTTGTFWEMPIFVKLGNKYMLLLNTLPQPAKAIYWIGDWNNETFIPDFEEPKQLDLINHLLSPSPAIDEKGRLVAIGIIPETRSTELQMSSGWAHLYSLPRVWNLGDDLTIKQEPLPELKNLRDDNLLKTDLLIEPSKSDYLTEIKGSCLEIIAEFELQNSNRTGLKILQSPGKEEQTLIYYNSIDKTLNIDLSSSSLNNNVYNKKLYSSEFNLGTEEKLKLHVFIDHSVVEVFVNDKAAFAKRVYPTLTGSNCIDAFSEGGNALLKIVEVYEINKDLTSVESELDNHEKEFELYQNYPNPFNPTTTIKVRLNSTSDVSITIYDSLGKKVKELFKDTLKPGTYSFNWDGKNSKGLECSSGVYYYTLNTSTSFQSYKMILLR